MKNIFFLILAIVGFVFTGCVDDYTDSNPPAQKDAPALRISASGDANVAVQSLPLNKYTAYVNYGEPVEFTVTVVNAPGKIGAIDVSSSIEEFGTVAIDEASVAALQGKTSGDFKFTFTPSADLPDQKDRALNIEVSVSDTQLDKDGESSPKTTTLTVPVTLVNGPCLSEGIVAGTYVVSDASGNLDGGETYDQSVLVDNSEGVFAADMVTVVITKVRPGVYSLSEVTGGIWPIFYSGRAKPTLKVDLCGNTITGRTGAVTAGAGTASARTFTLNGTLNDDGTINMTWSYVRDDGATPASPAMGSYKLTRIQ
jgi:hypothetical protein